VLGRPADARQLPQKRVLRKLARPRGLAALSGAETEEARQRVVRIVLERRPLLLGLAVPGPALEQQDIEAAFCELLCDDRASSARADDDHVARHQPFTFRRPW
jgi:hypothetical protein